MKELTGSQTKKIVSFWEESNLEEERSRIFLAICEILWINAKIDFMSVADNKAMWKLKYKYGKKLLREIKAAEKRVD
jgi:hypothetical protein